jgi:hypothetical protein
MILVRFTLANTPFVGKDRWSWPMSLINNEELIKNISKAGKTIQQKIMNPQATRLNLENPQHVWEDFKIQIHQLAKITANEHLKKIKVRTKQPKEDL